MTLYSFNGRYPDILPNRIRLSNGLTKTDKTTFTDSDLLDASLNVIGEKGADGIGDNKKGGVGKAFLKLGNLWKDLDAKVDQMKRKGYTDDKIYEEDKEEMSDDNAELFAEIGAVVKELLEEVKNDLARMSAELEELRSENLAKDENIAELQEENVELAKQVKDLGNEPGDEPVKLSKFKKEAVKLSNVEYDKLTPQQKYLYNFKIK